MTASSAATTGRPAEPGRGAAKVLAIVLGSLGAFVAIALLLSGLGLVWAHTTQRDSDGYFSSRAERLTTASYALTHEGVELRETPGWLVDRLGTVRLRATGADGTPLFVGIAPEADLERYLAGVAHDEVIALEYDAPYAVETRAQPGGAPDGAPGEQSFWSASATGSGAQTVSWEIAEGNWAFLVMNADGSRAVAADIELGARVDWLLTIGLALVVAAVLIGLGSAALIFFGVRASGGGDAAFAGAGAVGADAVGAGAASVAGEPAESTYPVAVEARLDEPLSRWLWLVKWLLAIPHFIVLTFLWMAFVVLTVVAFFAILFTGRYPRTIFDFNLGVMRWSWRAAFYSVSGIGTDRYPPFSLGPEPDYPATLEVAYPERLSRGLVLVKSWLLAIPHLLIVALFTGGAGWAWPGGYVEWPGLIAILTVIAGFILLFRGRYARDLFDLIVGLNRWAWRVAAYVALMRDEYPPFRLEP